MRLPAAFSLQPDQMGRNVRERRKPDITAQQDLGQPFLNDLPARQPTGQEWMPDTDPETARAVLSLKLGEGTLKPGSRRHHQPTRCISLLRSELFFADPKQIRNIHHKKEPASYLRSMFGTLI
jgi:hypothetical protein